MNAILQSAIHRTGEQESGAPAPAWLDVASALTIAPRPLDFVLPGLMAGSVGSIVGAGAAGKTMLALQIAVLMASGADTPSLSGASGWRPIQGRVVYLSGEDPAEVLSSRLHAIGQCGLSKEHQEALVAQLRITPLVGHAMRIDDARWRNWIEDVAGGVRLLIFDTLRRFHMLDENDGGAMAMLISKMEHVCRTSGTSILFLHHTSKASVHGGTASAQQASRGSSVLTDNIRWQANLSGMSEREAQRSGVPAEQRRNFVRLSFPKINYSPPIADRWFQRSAGGVLLPASAVADAVAKSGQKPRKTAHPRSDSKPATSVTKPRSKLRTQSEQPGIEVSHGLEF